MECVYCKKKFYDKSNLKRHQVNSKSCIAIQKNENNIKIPTKFQCEFCNKQLSGKQALNRHLNICKSKIIESNEIKEIKELKNIVNSLQDKISELEKESKPNITVINNTINNNLTINNIDFMSFMTAEKIKEVFDKYFDIKTLLGSKESLAQFTIENFLSGEEKPIYLCSDKQRNAFYFHDENKNRIDDTNAQILINLIVSYGFGSIQKLFTNYIKNTEQTPETLNIAFNNLMSLKKDSKNYINELSVSLPKTIKERQIRDKIITNKNYEKIEFDEIGGIPIAQLEKYKKHYINTNVILVPATFIKTKDSVRNYKTYLCS